MIPVMTLMQRPTPPEPAPGAAAVPRPGAPDADAIEIVDALREILIGAEDLRDAVDALPGDRPVSLDDGGTPCVLDDEQLKRFAVDARHVRQVLRQAAEKMHHLEWCAFTETSRRRLSLDGVDWPVPPFPRRSGPAPAAPPRFEAHRWTDRAAEFRAEGKRSDAAAAEMLARLHYLRDGNAAEAEAAERRAAADEPPAQYLERTAR